MHITLNMHLYSHVSLTYGPIWKSREQSPVVSHLYGCGFGVHNFLVHSYRHHNGISFSKLIFSFLGNKTIKAHLMLCMKCILEVL